MSYYVNPHSHSGPWFPYAEQFGAPNISWCEAHLGQWIDQPALAYSNGAYLLTALVTFWFAYRSRQKELMALSSIIFGVGLLSFVYHISNNYLTQMLDFVGMFTLLFWPMVLTLRKMDIIDIEHYLPVMIGSIVSFCLVVHGMYMLHMKFQILIVVLIVGLLVLEYFSYKKTKVMANYKFIITGAILISVAGIFSFLDVSRILCNPNNHFFQGHALWHILSAIAIGIAFIHYYQFDYKTGKLADYSSSGPDTLPQIPKGPKKRQNPYGEDIESQLEP